MADKVRCPLRPRLFHTSAHSVGTQEGRRQLRRVWVSTLGQLPRRVVFSIDQRLQLPPRCRRSSGDCRARRPESSSAPESGRGTWIQTSILERPLWGGCSCERTSWANPLHDLQTHREDPKAHQTALNDETTAEDLRMPRPVSRRSRKPQTKVTEGRQSLCFVVLAASAPRRARRVRGFEQGEMGLLAVLGCANFLGAPGGCSRRCLQEVDQAAPEVGSGGPAEFWPEMGTHGSIFDDNSCFRRFCFFQRSRL